MAALSRPPFHVVGLGGHASCLPHGDLSLARERASIAEAMAEVARLRPVRGGAPWR